MWNLETTLSYNKDIKVQELPDLSLRVTLICKWIIYAVLCQAINIFGTVTNILNIICFIKQGFKDPVNISLLGEIDEISVYF